MAAELADEKRFPFYLIVLLAALAVYAGCMISPPSLMDDVDAVQAQIARNMLTSGDWVTARLDGIPYLEKAPLIYWLIAGAFKIFGVSDWVARIPMVLAAVALAWLTMAFGVSAFGLRAGFYAGLCISTCFGLFLFTRILIPDVMLTLSIALSLWAFLRAIDETEPRARWWAVVMAASLGTSLLFKGLIGPLFPIAAALIYLGVTRQMFEGRVWKALHPFSGLAIALAIAAPWHILATLRNPPYFDFTMRSEPGQYHGFLWFYFINEHLLRFLNLRYPRDYDTVPRLYFWLFHLAVAVPMERVPSRRGKAQLQAVRSRKQGASAGNVLGGFYSGLLYFFHDAGILFDAVLSGPGVAVGVGDGGGGKLDSLRYARVVRDLCAGCGSCARVVFLVVESSYAWRYFCGAEFQSGGVQAFARPHGRPDDRVVCLSSGPAACGRGRVPGGSSRNVSGLRAESFLAIVLDGGALLSSFANRDGGVRPFSFFAPAGGSVEARAGGEVDCRPPLLHVLVNFLLHQSRCAAAQRAVQQSRLRLVCARRTGCVSG